jgi:septum formation protein
MHLILQLLDGKNQSESVLESPDMTNRTGDGIQLFLASNSPRRKELLALGGWEYDILSAQVDETPLENEDGMEYVRRLATSKVMTAANQTDVDGVIIAADTSVIDHLVNGKSKILGKPSDPLEAVEMLQDLRGHTHQVHTAIAIFYSRDGTIRSDCCTTNVCMRNYSDEEIKDYVASGDPMDKAGAYAIQHTGFHPVEKLDGCFANVMGLPLCHLTRSASYFGITPRVNIPRVCQATLRYDCPVYHQILIQNI